MEKACACLRHLAMTLTLMALENSVKMMGSMKDSNSTQLNSTGHVTLMAKRDQKKGKKATAYQYPLSLI